MPKPFKSPSDTTIYSPGLRKANTTLCNEDNALINKITNFVESICISSLGNSKGEGHHRTNDGSTCTTPDSRRVVDHHRLHTDEGETSLVAEEEANKTSDQLLVQAECFKAWVEAPKCTGNKTMVFPKC